LRVVEQQICGESDGMGEVISGGSNNGSINDSVPAQHSQGAGLGSCWKMGK